MDANWAIACVAAAKI
jgi:hypothetical protein